MIITSFRCKRGEPEIAGDSEGLVRKPADRKEETMIHPIKNRRSIRKYRDQAVPDDLVLQVLESARCAPSGDNTQPWRFIVVREEYTRQKLAEAAHKQAWMMMAPVHVVAVADIRVRVRDGEIALDETSPEWELKQIIRDTAIAMEHLVLEAESLGLGTCWVAWFTQAAIRPLLNIPADKYVVGIITLGYPDEAPRARPRKKLEELVRYEHW
ncbi:nitroreductase [Hydrogenispora ethanolica]|uniref:Nitroreductase n=2 Tax=Hydrogenispora ethanolica TaxID=1082276 RepID=A0A4R1QT52_HYDET|nr:nitroreductase [Hydrogenispora ethanolica]